MSQQALAIRWESMTRLPTFEKPVITTEETAAAPAEDEPQAKASDKPYFIYVTDGSSSDDVTKVEKVVLTDERIALGSRAFHAVRMMPDDAAADSVLAEKGGKEVPRILFVSADHKTVTTFEKNRLGVSGIWDAMRATSNKFYKENLDVAVKAMRDVLTDYDKVAGEQKTLADKIERSKDKKLSDSDQKDLDAKQADIEARLKKVQDKERAAEKLTPREAIA